MNLVIKRGLIAGIAILVAGFVFSFLIQSIFPLIAMEYQNFSIFRPWDDPLMMAMLAYPLILGVVLAYFWGIIEKNFKEGDAVKKAVSFANLYFLIATVPGMFISYTSFQLSFLMIALWTASGYLDAFIAGWIFAKVKK